jgi:hypothetical protein
MRRGHIKACMGVPTNSLKPLSNNALWEITQVYLEDTLYVWIDVSGSIPYTFIYSHVSEWVIWIYIMATLQFGLWFWPIFMLAIIAWLLGFEKVIVSHMLICLLHEILLPFFWIIYSFLHGCMMLGWGMNSLILYTLFCRAIIGSSSR